MGATVIAAALALAAQAGAEENYYSAYSELLHSRRSPAGPLVLTFSPAALGSLATDTWQYTPEVHGSWAMSVGHFTAPVKGLPHSDADLVWKDDGAKSLAYERKRLRRGNRLSTTRVRGKPGLLAVARRSHAISLAWIEDGHLYELGTGTPHTIPLAQLQQTATGLDHLRGELAGSTEVGGPQQSVHLFVTDSTLTFELDWSAECHEPGLQFGAGSQGELTESDVPLPGGSFSQALSGYRSPRPGPYEAPWTLAISATIAGGGGQFTLQATSDGAGLNHDEHCAVGPVSVGLTPSTTT